MCKVIEDFKISLIEDGKSPKTIESYTGDASAFVIFLEENGVDFKGELITVSGHQRLRACLEIGILEIPYVENTYPDFDEATGTSKEDMILEDLICTNLMQRGVGNVNAVKMCRCIVELERIYGIKKGNNQNSLPNYSVSSQEQLAKQIGIGVDTLQNYKKLNNLIPELQSLVEHDSLKATTAYKIWAKMPHGEWGTYLKEKVDFGHSLADKFMKVASEFSNSYMYTNLTHSKIFALLSLPSEERDDFMAQTHEIKPYGQWNRAGQGGVLLMVNGIQPQDKGAIRDIIAQKVGIGSGRTYECAKNVVNKIDELNE